MSYLPKSIELMNIEYVVNIKKWFEAPNLLYGFLLKYCGSLNNP